MRFTVPEYLLLLGLSALNIWAAFILASVRSRVKQEISPTVALEIPDMDSVPLDGSERRA